MKIKRQRKISCETFKNPSSGNTFDTMYIQITLLKLVTKKIEGEK